MMSPMPKIKKLGADGPLKINPINESNSDTNPPKRNTLPRAPSINDSAMVGVLGAEFSKIFSLLSGGVAAGASG